MKAEPIRAQDCQVSVPLALEMKNPMERICAIAFSCIFAVSLLATTEAINPASWTKEATEEHAVGDNWTPIVVYMGELPTAPGTVSYGVFSTFENVDILLYSFITIHDDGPFERGYYKIYTVRKSDGAEFAYYMNTAKVSDTIANSANFWLPLGTDFEPYVYAELVAAAGIAMKPKEQVRSCAGLDGAQVMQAYIEEEVIVGQIMLTGYRY